ncbi:MAG: hypothetical protein JWO55_151 [Candidatus Saccharibacteria bacterium]|jgi:hypothetical protein|nr:hypothetical protein [Candidatus Saccharibacteria bacterium]
MFANLRRLMLRLQTHFIHKTISTRHIKESDAQSLTLHLTTPLPAY